MSRNQAEDFAKRLYARVPGHYRVYDAERGQPLLALLRVVGAQVANLRQDLDALWDNFFIETCDEWVVPYIGDLVGANLLQQPVGQSNRLDVWNTVIWRRSKGTPQMLQALSQAISGWPTNLSEFFHSLGWSQNLNHVRLDRRLTPDLHDPSQLGLLGLAADPFAHAADFRPTCAMDGPRVAVNSLGVGRAGWGSPGRYQINNLGIFVRRLQTFPVKGATPAAAVPGATDPAGASCFTFNPLFRDTPLFAEETAAPITRSAFAADPWSSFGSESDIAVRQFGVLLATETPPEVRQAPSSITAFNFAGMAPSISLAEMRLLEPRSFQMGAAHFLITAQWQNGNTSTNLGFLSTLFAVSGSTSAFRSGATTSEAGQLVITVQTGRDGIGWTGPTLPVSPAARFPGAILAVRAARRGPLHSGDGLYIYLPPSFVRPGDVLTYFAADDGSTYTSQNFATLSLARASGGQVYPGRPFDPSTAPALAFLRLNRMAGAMVLADPTRFGEASILVESVLLTAPSTFQTLGGIATTTQTPSVDSDLQAPDPWPAFTFVPSRKAFNGQIPATGLLSILLRPVAGNFIPPAELVLINRAGQSLLVYLPEVPVATAQGVRLLVADDGSTYFAPTDTSLQQLVLEQQSLMGLVLARAAQGQVLPIPGRWPLQQRYPVALNLCRSERSSLLAVGELGIDPELGRFALPPNDPSLVLTSPPLGLAFDRTTVSTDFVEAFTDFVGAVNSPQRQLKPESATRFVSRSGDAETARADALGGAPVHKSVADAVTAAVDEDVIEILDSATYEAPLGIMLGSELSSLTIRAAIGQRPCLTFYQSAGQPNAASFTIASPMSLLVLNGLLISGGPLVISGSMQQLELTACTLDPASSTVASIVASDTNLNSNARYLLLRCVTGGMWLGQGVGQLTVADSIVDQQNGAAIAGASGPPTSPPVLANASAQAVQLERVTVLGFIFCNVLNASESLLNDLAIVNDQQSGCVRFTRFETGSVLPRRYRCVPDETQTKLCAGKPRCVAPSFSSRRFGRPDYVQLGTRCPQAILTAGEDGGEVGAFAGTQNTIRLLNLQIKLQEFMPVGLSAVIVAET
jgi:hypothetical protein